MRRALAAFIILPLLAAGCVNTPVDSASTLTDPLLDEAFARVSSIVDPEGGHGEPSFGVAPDGTLFANGRGGRGGGVYRSVDEGETWARIATPVEPMPNFDPDLAVDKDGTIWYSSLWIGCTAVAVSRDLGETWTSQPAVCNGPGSDRQYVIPTEGGTAYIYSHQLPTFYQMAMKTTDYGATWLPTGPVEFPDHHLIVNGGSGWGGGGFWNEARDSIYFTFTWTTDSTPVDAGTWGAGYARSRDGGLTWTVASVPNQGGNALGLGLVTGAADEAGNVYLTWGEDTDGDVAVYLAASADDGDTWNTPVRVDIGEGSNVFPAVTAGAPGRVAVAYYEADEAAGPSDVSADGLWNVTLAWTANAMDAAPAFSHAQLSPGDVKKGPICIDGTTCQGGREFLDYFQVHVLPDGRVGAIYNSLLDVPGTLVEAYTATDRVLLREA